MLKRTFDVFVAALLLAISTPLLLVISVIIKLDSPGPVLYRAERAGRWGKTFTMYKFRTMLTDAAQRGPGLTRRGDPRVTRVGHTLRKFKIDELPQFINVLKGDMSLVGPRPEDPRYVARYTPTQRRVLTVRPGIAGPAAVKYRHEEELLAAVGGDLEEAYLTVVLPDKLSMDLDYIRHLSFWRDIIVLAGVAGSLVSRRDNWKVQPRISYLPGMGTKIGNLGNVGDENCTNLCDAHSPFKEGRR